ncbi:MAG: type II toxin-antitoxin system RelE/ParE family toxin [Gammaproteobacteria bacterium]|nr:type II toxin-antitoxin system RelE/ParE family toxin [Gammaproteobacteria bacterium]
MRVRYSRETISDLRRVREFIEEKNPQAAQRMAALLLKGINQLKSFPGLGTEVHLAMDPEVIRDLVVGKYIVRYLIGSEEIYVLRVWQHRENRL